MARASSLPVLRGRGPVIAALTIIAAVVVVGLVDLSHQEIVIPRLDSQQKMHRQILQQADVRGIAGQTVFDHNELEVGMVRADFGQQAFGRQQGPVFGGQQSFDNQQGFGGQQGFAGRQDFGEQTFANQHDFGGQQGFAPGGQQSFNNQPGFGDFGVFENSQNFAEQQPFAGTVQPVFPSGFNSGPLQNQQPGQAQASQQRWQRGYLPSGQGPQQNQGQSQFGQDQAPFPNNNRQFGQ